MNQEAVISELEKDKSAYILRNDFINRSYHLILGNGTEIRIRQSVVHALFNNKHVHISEQPTNLKYIIKLKP